MPGAPPPRTVGLSLDVGGVSPGRDRAIITGIYADIIARIFMVLVIAAIFYWLNSQVMSFVIEAFKQDILLIISGKITTPDHRVITHTRRQPCVAIPF